MRLSRSIILAASILSAAAGVAATTGPIPVEPAAAKFNIGKLSAFALRDAGYVIANDGSVFALDGTPDEAAKVRADHLDAFYPADPRWRDSVLTQSREIIDRAVAGLATS